MYAVIATGGKQYKVQAGDVLQIEKIAGDVGASVTFDQVLMVADGANVTLGEPVVGGTTVRAHIVAQDKAKKILVFTYKRRTRFRKKNGHRQPFTAVKIDSIDA